MLEIERNDRLLLNEALKAGGAPVMWERAVLDALLKIRNLVPEGSLVLEVGYGDGLLSCFVCRELGWRMIGLDIDATKQEYAINNLTKYGMDGRIKFICCAPEETFNHKGQYDAVFIKTVLYNSKTLEEYGQWLDWILSVLKPGGVLINFESGYANGLMQMYRRLRKRSYTDLCLYTSVAEALYNTRFEILYRYYYGGWSQFFTPFPRIYRFAYRIEEAMQLRDANNCFIVSVIAKKSFYPQTCSENHRQQIIGK
jgi:predicted O-methyltransferase YrrM